MNHDRSARGGFCYICIMNKDRHNSESIQDNKELRKEIERLRKVIDNMRSRSDVYELKITTEDGEVVKTFRATYWKRKDAMNDLGVYGRKFDKNSKTHTTAQPTNVSPKKTVLKFTREDGSTFDGYVLRIKPI